ncbi:YadA-like family protein [Avibacterium avium]|uniref:YadA-like family protein n=1 Tax=Avibacterium avium TaxID=751 RepID=UPI003BF87860
MKIKSIVGYATASPLLLLGSLTAVSAFAADPATDKPLYAATGSYTPWGKAQTEEKFKASAAPADYSVAIGAESKTENEGSIKIGPSFDEGDGTYGYSVGGVLADKYYSWTEWINKQGANVSIGFGSEADTWHGEGHQVNNVSLGTFSGIGNMGSNRVNIGYMAGSNEAGDGNIAIGRYSGAYAKIMGNPNAFPGMDRERVSLLSDAELIERFNATLYTSRFGYNVVENSPNLTAEEREGIIRGTSEPVFSEDGQHADLRNGFNHYSHAIPPEALASNNIAIGAESQTLHMHTIAVGEKARSQGQGAIAIGQGAVTGRGVEAWENVQDLMAMEKADHGNENKWDDIVTFFAKKTEEDFKWKWGLNALAVGNHSVALEQNATALGAYANAAQVSSVALGAGSVAERTNNVSGYDASANAVQDKSLAEITALGDGTLARRAFERLLVENTSLDSAITAVDSETTLEEADKAKVKTALEALKGIKDTNAFVSTLSAVSVGDVSRGLLRQITGVAAGSEDTDAVNVWQLKQAIEKIQLLKGDDIALGDDSTITTDSTETTSGHQPVEIADDAKAFLGDDNVSNIAGKTPQGVVSVGSPEKPRRVQNVAAGKVTPKSTDAVNGSQLYSVINATTQKFNDVDKRINGLSENINQVSTKVKELDSRISRIDRRLDKMNKQRKAGNATALATAGLLQAFRPGQSGVTAAIGQYQGQSAIAVGISRVSESGKVGVKASFSANTQREIGGTVGVGYFW